MSGCELGGAQWLAGSARLGGRKAAASQERRKLTVASTAQMRTGKLLGALEAA